MPTYRVPQDPGLALTRAPSVPPPSDDEIIAAENDVGPDPLLIHHAIVLGRRKRGDETVVRFDDLAVALRRLLGG